MKAESSVMTPEERSMLVNRTLGWCNERRKDKGLKPLKDLPKGKRWDGASCPCGQACGYYVGYREYFDQIPGATASDYMAESAIGPLPDEVEIFARQFDQGSFPEYDEEEGG